MKNKMRLIFSLILAVLVVSVVASSDGEYSGQDKSIDQKVGNNEVSIDSYGYVEPSDRIRLVLRRYIENVENAQKIGQGQLQPARAHQWPLRQQQSSSRLTRQANSGGIESELLSKLLDSSLNLTGQRADQDQEQQYVSSPSGEGQQTSGQKMIRNGQSVYMRLPPRFGKRSD